MPCPTNAPINLPTSVNQPCKAKCNFEYNYGLARCSVTNNSTYLDIQCFDGNNTVKCEMIGGSLIVTSVRLYAPSLNTYDGFHADAELIITHNANGKSLYVCIPVISSEKAGPSAKWFSKVVPFSPTKKGGSATVQINVNNFTLNDVMPQAAFTVFDNGTFDWNCAQDNVLILFHKKVAVNMKSRDYRTLTSLISKASYSMGTPQYLTFNKTGTTAGPGKKSGSGKGKTMTCKPITYPDGTPITGSGKARLNWIKSPLPAKGGSMDLGVLKWVLIVIAAILVVGVLGYLLYYVFTRGALANAFGGGSRGSGGTEGSG